MLTRLALVALLLAAPAHAQHVTPQDFPTVDFGRLHPGDAVPGQPGKVFIHTGTGWIVASSTPAPTVDECNPRPNPYLEPDKAVRCAVADRERMGTPPMPVFTVGARYRHAYPGIGMVVLSVSATLEGVPVVTAQFTSGHDAGSVFAFKAHEGQPWSRVP